MKVGTKLVDNLVIGCGGGFAGVVVTALGINGFQRSEVVAISVDLLGVVIAAAVTILVAVEIPRRQQHSREAKIKHEIATSVAAFKEALKFEGITDDPNYNRGMALGLKVQALNVEILARGLEHPTAIFLIHLSAIKYGTEQFLSLIEDEPITLEKDNFRNWADRTYAQFEPTLDQLIKHLEGE